MSHQAEDLRSPPERTEGVECEEKKAKECNLADLHDVISYVCDKMTLVHFALKVNTSIFKIRIESSVQIRYTTPKYNKK
jgi:hypothetical protein